MRKFIYLLFCAVFFQQTAASSCEDENLQRAITVLKTAVHCKEFPNPTQFSQHRGSAVYTITKHYEKELEKDPESRDEFAQKLAQLSKLQEEGGLLIQADYSFECAPIMMGISLGEVFKRLDLAEPLMTKSTYGLKELFRGYIKHWETCPHRETRPYRSDWQKIQTNKSIHRCCFKIIPIFQKYYDSEEPSLHHHFLIQSFLQAQTHFTNHGFDQALAEIKKTLNPKLVQELSHSMSYTKIITLPSHPTPQQDQHTNDSGDKESTLDLS